jgi:threonine synthase
VQAARCAPYHAAFVAGSETLVPTEVAPTLAEGIASAQPTRVSEVLRAVRETGGTIVAVEEAEIVDAQHTNLRVGHGLSILPAFGRR